MASFVISIEALKRNSRILRETADEAGCKIVLALKGFSCWKAFEYIRGDLDGCCASGLWEALLARDYFGKHVVTYSPAYQEEDIRQLCEFSHHLDFNSLSQWFRFRDMVVAHPRFQSGELHCGLRVNPQCSTGQTALYDPCVPGSRLGITADQLEGADLTGLSGLHFHTLCEQNSDDLEKTLAAVDKKFGHLLRSPQFKYLNMGGGHWITKPFYDRDLLIRKVRETREKYDVEVWLEPGEAGAIHTGVLRSEVLDVFESAGHKLAIMDISATAHMPDVLEMPYRPDVFLVEKDGSAKRTRPVEITAPAVQFDGEVYEASEESEGHVYRLGGPTCLAGDVTGDFAFSRPLKPGDILVFDDMAHYTMVKTTTFNGVPHPSIVFQHEDGRLETVREFGYPDFRDRLA
ncbi:carboxynorspermidine decarboxylase [Luteolibacter luteus]|uniref:Carboxynorspermidine/carboxyspermidine decarboxylase n=1 Tax=Luteolibacter luteus TaxID=2728835 RepID=A0A858RN05_9BACT|nr:carboxynorspermidine decarboxylase [Luteolibacter luteus]QJE98242.1 carboxynorspermidine decarboxylase [Luteolibacter luteus]